jgi:primase-polymerase (primpol)-like protein
MTDLPRREDLPRSIANRNQWVCWRTEDRDGKPTKIPIDPSTGRFASTTDPSTWCSFDRAYEYALGADGVAGLGFVFTEDDPFVGVDLDGCRDPDTGRPAEVAKTIVDRLDSYTEVSPSGTGYHVIVRGDLPEGRNRHGDIECYATSRYFTVTGDHVSGTPEGIEQRSEVLAAIHAEYVAAETTETTTKAHPFSANLADRELLQKARQASNSERFERLWNGSTVDYPSHSEADMALCCHLAFWTGGDPEQMDRLFRDSGLMRKKWDEVHFADGSTYGEKTISRAAGQVTDYYAPNGISTEPETVPVETRIHDAEEWKDGEQANVGDDRTDERLRGTIERLDERIEALEAENERLRAQLARKVPSDESPVESPRSSHGESLWSRAKRLFGSL